MKKQTLKADVRNIIGRKVKRLRKEGLIPCTIYGKNIKSQSMTVKNEDFTKLIKEAGESQLVEIVLKDATRPVLIHGLQRHPVTRDILHVEFFQVNLKEKVHTNVQIEITGESPAVKDNRGNLLVLINEIEIEALPNDIPENITIDISKLAEVDSEIKASDLKLKTGVEILTAKDTSIVRIAPLVKEEAAPAKTEDAVAENTDATGDDMKEAENTEKEPAESKNKEQ